MKKLITEIVLKSSVSTVKKPLVPGIPPVVSCN